ncbi:uncharacterized protein LOC111284626 isoform X3 [Durio zibethinus]|uniref:Uncharacterized protein LOC111284626 isoform X3 n=1 Tax=Durio zibethinus TaxID=66656 RepID=A0A6P5XMK2_DURZI|nr:uncharacterized protein LOC111284626 isoform X3 [Durio zibethinus]
MLRVNRVINQTRASISTLQHLLNHEQKLFPFPPQHFARKSSNRFFDIYKIAIANKILIPAMAARKFPAVDVIYSDGRKLKLPVIFNGNGGDADKLAVPKASLVCLSFRANSQGMVDSWSKPFYETFSESKNVQIYEVSFIDSWLLCLNPIKRLLLRFMRKSIDGEKDILQKHIVYSFGDHYYFRKELKILNLLTGYIFLLDKFGRVRWQGFGLAKQEELSSLLSCTTLLLEEK